MSGTEAETAVVEIEPVTSGDRLSYLKTLFVEYAEALEYDLCFEHFDRELDTLPGLYSPPDGNLWIARVDGAVAGCVALRRVIDLNDGMPAGEIKRLYVRPRFRGHSLGTRLIEAAIDFARSGSYRRLLLDTVGGRMERAIGLYRGLGFRRTGRYYEGAPDGVDFYRLDL
ncbi:GNAT family N-acetyltransferase [Marivibrio halodurans]|uniref:GNAT family N-acetyltransferase n=1 Tax=Marivibrio halodurans TaxID=2039722 RepID=A0A8J7RZV2_9PROT|nr:GNAT family N-acetyltransferase [Marivibrio halodurans]